MVDADAAALAADIEFLDRARLDPDAAAHKGAVPQRLSVRPGDLVLEVGPGTGDDLQNLVASAGEGTFGIGVDISLGVASEAKDRASGQRNIAFTVGDATRLPFRDNAMDCIYFERVLQHVAKVEDAIAEFLRVLTPGGHLLAYEPDQELRAIDHPDRETEAALRHSFANGFANPTIGRRLFGLLSEAGFEVISVAGDVRHRRNPDIAASLAEALSRAVQEGAVAVDRAEAYLSTVREKAADGTLFSIWIAFAVSAKKPSQ